ncbi:MAG TPA: sulfotransferase [Candidatus Obscuribacterales bacterium]
MVRPLIHVGYQKTGTTWLQKQFFPNSEFGWGAFSRREIEEAFVLPNALDFDALEVRKRYFPEICRLEAQERVAVLSCERLCGQPDSGGHDSKEMADRLYSVFPEARILIVVREQIAMIAAAYKQYVRTGGGCSLERYLMPPERGRNRVLGFDFAHFQYHRLVSYYQSKFGKDSVLVLPYELFVRQPAEFASRILAFADLIGHDTSDLPFRKKSNESLSAVALSVKRRLNCFLLEDRAVPNAPFAHRTNKDRLEKAAESLDRILPASVKQTFEASLHDKVKGIVGSRYRKSNQTLCSLTGLPLSSFGYDLGEAQLELAVKAQ